MLKKQKERIQICLSQEQIRYLDQWAQILGDCKNYSEAISKILYDHETKSRAIETLRERAAIAAGKKSYEEIRNDQIAEDLKTPMDKPMWDFLKQYQHAPIDKSKNKVKFTKVKVSEWV